MLKSVSDLEKESLMILKQIESGENNNEINKIKNQDSLGKNQDILNNFKNQDYVDIIKKKVNLKYFL